MPNSHMTGLTFREATTSDAKYLDAGFSQLSPESRYSRFFSGMNKLPEPVRRQLTTLDGSRNAAVVALDEGLTGAASNVPVGVARWNCDDNGEAHLAITVVDSHQRLGVGRDLLQSLFDLAIARGVVAMHADVLATNGAMRRLLGQFPGIAAVPSGDARIIAYSIDTSLAALG
jgi:GNAT superfamily N-acetyltransferase